MINDAVRIFMAILALILVSLMTTPLQSELRPIVKNSSEAESRKPAQSYGSMDLQDEKKGLGFAGKGKKVEAQRKGSKILKNKSRSLKVADKRYEKKSKRIKKS